MPPSRRLPYSPLPQCLPTGHRPLGARGDRTVDPAVSAGTRDKEPMGVFLNEAKRELRQVIERFDSLTVNVKRPVTRWPPELLAR
jgi:hypothetical protein